MWNHMCSLSLSKTEAESGWSFKHDFNRRSSIASTVYKTDERDRVLSADSLQPMSLQLSLHSLARGPWLMSLVYLQLTAGTVA